MSRSEPVDVCIIGAGVAGTMLAYDLARAGVNVLLLEAGPRHARPLRPEYMREKLYGLDPWASDHPARDRYATSGYSYPLNKLRVKAVGGTGLHWHANVDRLHESDFELNSRYGRDVDWPIRYRDLEPYYSYAEELIGIAGEDAYPWTPWRESEYPMPPFPMSYVDQMWNHAFDQLGIPLQHNAVARTSVPYKGRPACAAFSMCETCPIFAKWTPDLLLEQAEATGSVAIQPHVRATRINCTKDGKAVESISARSIVNGQVVERYYHARFFVLAAHAVETARLLLLSPTSDSPGGLGNRYGYVGKFFSDHPGVVMKGKLNKRTYTERIGFSTAVSYHFYESSRQGGDTAFVLGPQNRYVQSPLDIVNEVLHERLIWGNELKGQVQERFGYAASLIALVEQPPHAGNHIVLDKNLRDDIGLPVPHITYDLIKSPERRTIKRATRIMRRLFSALEADQVHIHYVGPSGHHMGTTRMGNDPRLSVVDSNLQVHGVENLYVVGSGVFPTFGAVGPTLTIAALALRLGTHLRAHMGGLVGSPKRSSPS